MEALFNGSHVLIKGSTDNGIVISSELKRFSYINNGKQIRMYKVKLSSGSILEYEIGELRLIS